MKVIVALLVVALGCQKSDENKSSGTKVVDTPKKSMIPQVDAPLDIKTPPPDATRTESGLVYKTLVKNPAGQAPKRNDTVMIKYTGWRQASGETFFSNKDAEQAMPLNLASTARGFTEAMQMVRKGEKAMLWLPPAIGLKAQNQKPETLVYEVEVIDIQAAPADPPDTKQPPPDALTTKRSQIKYVVVRPGTGKDVARSYDDVTFHYTAWDGEGRMVETTEMKNRPAKSAPFRQPVPFEEILTLMTAGQRVRFWAEAEKMKPQHPVSGVLCYEVEVVLIEKAPAAPPPTPPDVAKPPGDAQKTAKGVFYKVLKAGKGGPKPTPTDQVKVHYTGWTTDGRMFDSSMLKNEPAQFGLNGVIAGWTDGIPLMSVGDRYRFWIPDTLAYKGQPSRPQGMLVFDVELLEIKPGASPDMPPGGDPHGGGMPPGMPPGHAGHP